MPSFVADDIRQGKGVKFYVSTRKLAPGMKAYEQKDPVGAASRRQMNESIRSMRWGTASTKDVTATPARKTPKKRVPMSRRPYNSGPELDTRDLVRIDTASDLTGVGRS